MKILFGYRYGILGGRCTFVVDLFDQLRDDPNARITTTALTLYAQPTRDPDHPPITRTRTRAGGVAVIRIQDTGVGISEKDMPHIFERFWRADRARSRPVVGDARGGGFGLGLAISQWIAQAHGGSLTAQSRLGRGSIFTVLLPVAPAPAGAA